MPPSARRLPAWQRTPPGPSIRSLRDPTKSNYFSEVTADNLKNYEMFYSNNPTGPVFTNAPSGAQKKQIFVDYWNNGGAWAGQHSATDFENNNQLDVVPGQHRRRLVRRPRQSDSRPAR